MKRATMSTPRGVHKPVEARWKAVEAAMESLRGDPAFEMWLDAVHLLKEEFVQDCKLPSCIDSHPQLTYNVGAIDVCDRILTQFGVTETGKTD